jgi:hypothetical protein
MKRFWVLVLACTLGAAVSAKLPPPTPEAQAKAAEAKAKAGYAEKVAAYQLCKAQERAAAAYFKKAKAEGREVHPPVPTPPCVEPGPFVYTPEAAPAAAPAAAAGASAAKKS